MNSSSHYDVAIIGAGMSGLAAGIRLAHFGKKVCIFERHNAVGGLNSFYSMAGRKFDVGLHALTNYVPPGVKGTPLAKLFRQLRIDRDELPLWPQKRSRVAFGTHGELSLPFTNDFSVFEHSVAEKFPREIDGFRRLVAFVKSYDAVAIDAPTESARGIVQRFVHDAVLEDMIFCPIMFYGSPQERDMTFRDFAVLFQSIFLEGFCRPVEGVRAILRLLLDRYREAGGERRMKCGVKKIVSDGSRVTALLLDDGSEISANQILSSIGAVETERLYRDAPEAAANEVGRLSFIETVNILRAPPANYGWEDTIIFFNTYPRFHYERPATEVDLGSGVICLPNNFAFPPEETLPEGVVRCTLLANYDLWKAMPEDRYRESKARWLPRAAAVASKILSPGLPETQLTDETIATDIFTPTTIEKFTGHLQGAVYGSHQKNRGGKTGLENLYLCGTDQGYLGIVGAMLSGISMANAHVLQGK